MAVTILSILPLLIAVSYAVWSLQRQNSDQRQLMEEIDAVTSNSGNVSEHVTELVRFSRQYAILQDQSFVDLYQETFEAMHSSIELLRPLLTRPASQRLMDTLLETATEVRALLDSKAKLTQTNLATSLQLLVALREGLSSQAEIYRRRSLAAGERQINRVVNRLFILTILTLPSTLLLMVTGIYMASRPLWRLNEAIQQLAKQHWETPINIRGPADLVVLGENLEWMRKQIVASDRQKTAFVQHITHELKTPLAAIIEAGNLIHEEVSGPLTPQQRSILGVLRANASSLEHLIQQLLNYNVVSHGMVTLWEDMDIQALCQSIRSRLESSNPDKKVNWNFTGSPEKICSDARLLEMILSNLLGNAFQFVPNDGNITVQWSSNRHEWHLSVSDDGPGIDPDELANIYTPFYMGNAGGPSKVPKTGIGLAIVKECVNLLKGRIEARSGLGKGVSFTMSFPVTSKQEL